MSTLIFAFSLPTHSLPFHASIALPSPYFWYAPSRNFFSSAIPGHWGEASHANFRKSSVSIVCYHVRAACDRRARFHDGLQLAFACQRQSDAGGVACRVAKCVARSAEPNHLLLVRQHAPQLLRSRRARRRATYQAAQRFALHLQSHVGL